MVEIGKGQRSMERKMDPDCELDFSVGKRSI